MKQRARGRLWTPPVLAAIRVDPHHTRAHEGDNPADAPFSVSRFIEILLQQGLNDLEFEMQESEVLSRLISDIYDAALAPELWVPLLGKLTKFADGYSATLCVKDSTGKKGDAFYGEGKIDMDRYFERYLKLDPTTSRFLADVGIPVGTEDFIANGELRKTRFFKEWVRPQRLVDFATMVVDRSRTTASVLTVLRHERHGLVDGEMRRKMRFVLPHLRRSLLIGKTIEHATLTHARLADTLDNLSAAVFLIDDMRGIVHANHSGRAMLASRHVLRAVGGRLAARDPKSDRDLQAVLDAAGMGDAAIGVAGVTQPLTARDGECYVAHVMPLTSGARREAAKHYGAVAVLFVHKGALRSPSNSDAIARFYRLTPSELRVLLAVVKVGGVPEIAEALGVNESTVRSHLQHIFQKTGNSRQADLVKLVAGFANPFMN